MHFIAENLRYIRKLWGYTQLELGKRLGPSRGNIASYENRQASPSVETLITVSRTFQINLQDLILKELSVDLPHFLDRDYHNTRPKSPDSLDQASGYALHQQASKLVSEIRFLRKVYDLRKSRPIESAREKRLNELDYERLMHVTDLLAQVQEALSRKEI